MKGFFTLGSKEDLFDKLTRDFELFVGNPTNVDYAFNFFVTAEHLLDWLYPGGPRSEGEDKRKDARASRWYLTVTWDLCSGAKHFEPSSKLHTAVASTGIKVARVRTMTPLSSSRIFSTGPMGHCDTGPLVISSLAVNLHPDQAKLAGESTVAADRLARLVYGYWADQFPALTRSPQL